LALALAACGSASAVRPRPGDASGPREAAGPGPETTAQLPTTAPETAPPAAGPPAAAPAPPVAATDAGAVPPDAARTASGLATKVMRRGTGAVHPGPTSRVTVHYMGWHPDGTIFDSSYKRGRPATFPLNAVIAGWTEGVQLMVTGEKRRLWIPEELAYKGVPGRPAGLLIFDVELLAIEE
jgi:peptidylprolyl isomerase